jgi:hypothetical protein
VAWQFLTPSLVGVQHRLPTVYLANFNEADLFYFKAKNEFSIWDTQWTTMLMKSQRLRYIGSSDGAFACEITKEKFNVPEIASVNMSAPDEFYGDLFHNRMLRQFVSIFRL